MLKRGGADVALAGFYRGVRPPESVGGVEPVILARTSDGAFVQRAAAVAGARMSTRRLASALGDADVILARNLETLPLAVHLRERSARPVRFVYEVLDVHQMMLGASRKARFMRAMEERLARGADLLLTSSEGFIAHYFGPLSGVKRPTLVVENKLLSDLPPPRQHRAGDGPPWRIGLFGALRCARSLEILSSLARDMDGKVEVAIRGRPSPNVFRDLAGDVTRWPHCTFHGAYQNPADLADIYGDVHFAFAIDYFEAGGNSEWLLPNRLYEAGAYGVVPLARAGTQTAAKLERLGCGIVLSDVEADLRALFEMLDATGYARERARVEALPRDHFVASDADCAELVRALAGEPVATLDAAA